MEEFDEYIIEMIKHAEKRVTNGMLSDEDLVLISGGKLSTRFNKAVAASLISLCAINAVSPGYSTVYAQKNEVQNFETIPKASGNMPKENTNKKNFKKENKTLKTKLDNFWKTTIKEVKENPVACAVALAAFAAYGVYFFYLFGNNNGSKFSTAKTQNLKQEKNFEEEQRLINERVDS